MSPSQTIQQVDWLPVFPLPGVVFFPRTVLPLHVFEPRYRQMVQDVADGPRLIAVSLLAPGWEEDYKGSPPFHEIGTVGRIEDLRATEDGRYNLRLVGLHRVRLGEVVQEKPYRRVRFTMLKDQEVDENAEDVLRHKLDILASHGCLMRELTSGGGEGLVLDERVPFASAVNGACANLPVDPQIRQQLLQEDDLLERSRRTSEYLDGVLKRVLQLKAMRHAEDDDPEIN